MQTWAVEWGAGGQLSRDGVTRESLKPGDIVIIKGNPGRNPDDHRIRMQSITRPLRRLELERRSPVRKKALAHARGRFGARDTVRYARLGWVARGSA